MDFFSSLAEILKAIGDVPAVLFLAITLILLFSGVIMLAASRGYSVVGNLHSTYDKKGLRKHAFWLLVGSLFFLILFLFTSFYFTGNAEPNDTNKLVTECSITSQLELNIDNISQAINLNKNYDSSNLVILKSFKKQFQEYLKDKEKVCADESLQDKITEEINYIQNYIKKQNI